ncbi:unnamed protein product [Schistosoma mattheei]|uniref:Uncharacterized protein n=1 Tax=Schistosoma mattheei TaxID=31246 RepID=A0A183NPC0_9TREM|nr:unnamed protein product [Schistosoma mattheei]
MLGISECNSKENDNFLDSKNFDQTELIPQLEQTILQKFSPILNRLTVKEINLDNYENVCHDLQQLSDIASLVSDHNILRMVGFLSLFCLPFSNKLLINYYFLTLYTGF